jgi:hypothetical protein
MVWLLMLALQATPATNPHGNGYTTGTGLSCAYCHGKTPHAEDMYRAAGRMSKMVAGLNEGPLKQTKIACFTCHRAGGPEHHWLHPPAIDRNAVQKIIDAWPGPATATEELRRTMGRYAVSLGVQCSYCHVTANWKADNTPTMKTARAMASMMEAFPKYFEYATASAFTCFSCHQGAVKVPR